MKETLGGGLKHFCSVTNSLSEAIELSYLCKLRAMRVVSNSITGNKLTPMIETQKCKCDSISIQFQKSLGTV